MLPVLVAAAVAGPGLAGAVDPASARLAARIREVSGVRGGLVVHLGCGDGRLTAALCAGDAWIVHGLDREAAHAEEARARLRDLGLYGPVSVERWTGARLPYADNLVNLVVAEDFGDVPMDEVRRALVPGGAAVRLKSEIADLQFAKPWPSDTDDWTHWLHGPDANAVARDRLVGPPGGVQWVEGPRWSRHHELNTSVPALVSAKGRVFYLCDEAPATAAGLPDAWALLARDAFNGVLLWKRPVGDWGWKAWSTREAGGRFNLPIHIARRLVADADRLYVTLGFSAPLTALDAATGETLRTYAGTEFTDEVLHRQGLLVLSVGEGPQKPGLIREAAPPKKHVLALKADSGQVLWKQGPYAGIADHAAVLERITHLNLALGPSYVVLVEEEAVVRLDLATGRQTWRWPRGPKTDVRGHVPYKPPNLCTLVAAGDVVLFAQPDEPYTTRTWNRGVRVTLTALDAAAGRPLWTEAASKWGPGVEGDVFVIGGLVWTHAADDKAAIGLDLKTGRIARQFSTAAAFSEAHHHRCYRNKATERYLLTARRGIEFLDLQAETCSKNHWVRGSCRFGVMPANGLVYVPPHACQCYIDEKLSGFFALGPASGAASAGGAAAPAAALEKGPAFGAFRNPPSEIRSAMDWPTYRHDAARRGATPDAVPDRIAVLWQADLGGRPSACTVAGGRVYAAAVHQHRLASLDARDGKCLWTFTAGGRIDTPPTLHGDLVLFGAADGWLYALRAADGALGWRLRVAPDERRILAFGQLESAWPVHGTVLVKEGLAYAAAGRSGHLDGGIRIVAVRPETGEVVRTFALTSGLEDVLVADESGIYMRRTRLAAGPAPERESRPAPAGGRKGGAGKAAAAHGPAAGAFSTAGLLDDSCFSRTGWSVPGGGGGAHLVVFTETASYAFGTQRGGGFGGWFTPGTGAYRLSAVDLKAAPAAGGRKARWSVSVPIRVRAMALAGETLLVAGAPDVVDESDPWAATEGRRGGVLRLVAADDGRTLAERRLDAPPVWDGLAVAGGCVYLSLADGRVLCLGAPTPAAALGAAAPKRH